MNAERIADRAPDTPRWPTPADELPLFEGLRAGDVTAFTALTEVIHPLLGGLLGRYAPAVGDRRDILERSWACALSSLDMFRWQTTLATWVAGIAVEHGRAHAARHPQERPPGGPPVPGGPRAGPADWRDLPWGPRWQGAREATDRALAGLALPALEVLQVRRVEGWSARRTCDVLGLTAVGEERLLDEAEEVVHDALAALVELRAPVSSARREAVGRMLLAPSPLDPLLGPPPTKVFRAWRASQRRGWRRLLPA